MGSFSRGGNTNTEAVGVKVNFWKVQFDTFWPQKFYPLLTTFVACWRRPTKDKISLLVAFFLWSQVDSSCWIQCNLSPDKRISMRCVSKTIPRKVKEVVGPSAFSNARGMPRSVHICWIVSKLRWQVCAPGGRWWENHPDTLYLLQSRKEGTPRW